jgi:hypothetical protein
MFKYLVNFKHKIGKIIDSSINYSQKCCKDYCKNGEELKKCKRRASLYLHPDKGGDTNTFQEFNTCLNNMMENQYDTCKY